MKRPTISDIAQRAGVSKGAVSYALNGLPGVSDATRMRVLAIADEIGWRPNNAARALSGAASQAVGLALMRPAKVLGIEPFFMELISGVEAELSGRSYALTLQIVTDRADEEGTYRRWWGERRVDGVLLCDVRVDDSRIGLLEELDLPAVIVGGPTEATLPQIWTDDIQVINDTVEYLVALGHRRIARVAGLSELMHTSVREAAFAEACQRSGVVDFTTVPTDYTGEEGGRATRRLLSSATRPTALIYDNDVMAIAGLACAHEMGIAVPSELSLVAWDDSTLCQIVHPPLTALSRDIPGQGQRAARTLLDVIAGEPVQNHQEDTARLTPRGSTAPPARS